jgi:hypothetical protein
VGGFFAAVGLRVGTFAKVCTLDDLTANIAVANKTDKKRMLNEINIAI